VRYLAVIGVGGWAICEGLGFVLDWALNVEEGSL
jgi:hypothetical protein